MDERNTRQVKISSRRTVRSAAGEQNKKPAHDTQRRSRSSQDADSKPKKQEGFTVQKALIIAASAVVIVCLPLMIYTLASSKADATEVSENTVQVQAVTAVPTGEEGKVLEQYIQQTEGESTGQTGETGTESETTGDDMATYKKGESGAEIARIQSRLMSLGYMAKAETTDYFGSATEGALKLFQKVYGFTEDGVATPEVRKRLFAESTPYFTLSEGSENEAVKTVQKKLNSMGYLSAEATGYFGSETAKAVKNFQEKNKLTVDGKVGLATWNKLNSSDAVKAKSETASPSPTQTE